MIGCEQPANYHPEGDVYVHTQIARRDAESRMQPRRSRSECFFTTSPSRKPAPSRTARSPTMATPNIGAEMATDILARLRRSRAVQERVAYLVKNHLRLTMAPRMRTSTLKRMLSEDGFDELLELSQDGRARLQLVPRLLPFLRAGAWRRWRRAQMRPPRLISGDDLIGMGFKPGPRFQNHFARKSKTCNSMAQLPTATRPSTTCGTLRPHPRPERAARSKLDEIHHAALRHTVALDGVDFMRVPARSSRCSARTARAKPR